MKVELDPQLVYSILWEACDVMDKDEFALKVPEVYGECAQIIARNIEQQLLGPIDYNIDVPDCPAE